ncbi:MAG: branched-chain amino acid ABC transporter permease [Actinobacteria bacterium]|nr:branched-chain amino acid ABC transporter permease [Actinomycetota bacterium]
MTAPLKNMLRPKAEAPKPERSKLEDFSPALAARLPSGVVEAVDGALPILNRLRPLRFIAIALLLGAIALPLGPAQDEILIFTGYFALAALGLNVVVGLAGLLDLGYVAFLMIGAYATAFVTESSTAVHPFIVHPLLALPVAVGAAMITGIVLGTPTLRLRGDYLAIVTLGFHEIVRQTAKNLEIVGAARGVTGIPSPDFTIPGTETEITFGVLSPQNFWFIIVAFIIAALFMIGRLKDSRIGRAWEAIREDEIAAAAMGVPVVKMKLYAFSIGASTSGLAGWTLATKVGFINPDTFPLLSSILVLCAVVIGGIGSSFGALVGAAIVFGLPELMRDLGFETIFGFDVETGRIAIFGILLVILMIFRPGGLVSSARRRAELTSGGSDIAGQSTTAAVAET